MIQKTCEERLEKCRKAWKKERKENFLRKIVLRELWRFAPFEWVVIMEEGELTEPLVIGYNLNEAYIFDYPDKVEKFEDNLDDLYNHLLKMIEKYKPLKLYISLGFPLTASFEEKLKELVDVELVSF